MKYLKKYNEAVGLAESTIVYSDLIIEEFSKKLDLFLSSDDKKAKYETFLTREDLESITNKPDWNKFPVSEIEIAYVFNIIPSEEFSKKYYNVTKYKNWVTNGLCHLIEDKKLNDDPASYILPPINDKSDVSIHLSMEVGCIISEGFENKEGLKIEIESSILHELNHAYEGWARKKSKSGQISTNVTYATDLNRPRLKKELFNVWYNNIGYMLYWSEKHEINAMVQEAWPYIKKYDIAQLKETCTVWRIAVTMSEFNIDDFKKSFYETARMLYPNITDDEIEHMLKNLKNGFGNALIDEDYFRDEGEDKASISGERILKMSVDTFIKWIQIRINKTGEKIKKRVMRLYSLK